MSNSSNNLSKWRWMSSSKEDAYSLMDFIEQYNKLPEEKKKRLDKLCYVDCDPEWNKVAAGYNGAGIDKLIVFKCDGEIATNVMIVSLGKLSMLEIYDVMIASNLKSFVFFSYDEKHNYKMLAKRWNGFTYEGRTKFGNILSVVTREGILQKFKKQMV